MSRPYYPTKADWADAQADAYAKAADLLASQQLPAGDWRGVRSKMEGIDRNRAEERRFRRMAENFRRRAA